MSESQIRLYLPTTKNITKENTKTVQFEHVIVFNERLKVKTDGSTRLVYTGLHGELEHIKIEKRLIDESFGCVMGECVI